MSNTNIRILIIPPFSFLSLLLILGCASSGNYICKRTDVDGNEWQFCCTHYVAQDGECISCPKGFTSTKGSNCTPCERPFYGRHCVHECKCMENETCHHSEGCVKIKKTLQITSASSKVTYLKRKITPQTTPLSSKTTYVVSTIKDASAENVDDKTVYYVALGCVFAIAILMGLLLQYLSFKKQRV